MTYTNNIYIFALLINQEKYKIDIMKRLQDNVTIITGGGKGIGYGMACAFAKEGSKCDKYRMMVMSKEKT